MATIRGEAVDRPAVSFYEINGLDQNPDNKDPFNIYSHPSWKPLINLAREKTDRIVMRSPVFGDILADPLISLAKIETHTENDSLFAVKKVKTKNKTLTCRTRRDKDVNTIWTEEHLLKDLDDLKEFLELLPATLPEPNIKAVIETEKKLGDTGIVMVDTPDPLCLAALLFDLQQYTIIAMTEQKLFHGLVEGFAKMLTPQIEKIAKTAPGRLWRIYGPEFASEPFLPPRFFKEYVVRYDKPIIDTIRKYDGYARIHSHGRLKNILDDIISTGCTALDPIEPPPQGDVELSYVRKNYGKDLVLFGNIEVTDIENLPTEQFEKKIEKALKEGTEGDGRGFVLMPSACPYGRVLSDIALKNYEKMTQAVEKL